jgi:hypothetical protein
VSLHEGRFSYSTVSNEHDFELSYRFRCLSYPICTSMVIDYC